MGDKWATNGRQTGDKWTPHRGLVPSCRPVVAHLSLICRPFVAHLSAVPGAHARCGNKRPFVSTSPPSKKTAVPKQTRLGRARSLVKLAAPLKGQGRVWLGWIESPTETCRTPQRAGHGWAGPRARPNLAEPFRGHGRAWLGWAESPTEPCRAHQRTWQGMVGLGRSSNADRAIYVAGRV